MNIQQIQDTIFTLKRDLIEQESIKKYHGTEYGTEYGIAKDKVESIESQIDLLEGQKAHLEKFEEIQKEEADQRLEKSREYHCGHDDVYGSGMDNLTNNNKEE
jgi:cob(I)alamin adenosyltransferase